MSDPRKIKSDLTDADLSCWLDVEKLGTAGQGEESMGMVSRVIWRANQPYLQLETKLLRALLAR